MNEMPRTVIEAYRSWITSFPADYHPLDRKRFYIFLHILFFRARKSRSREWFVKNLKDDTNLNDKDIERLANEYELLRDFMSQKNTALGILRLEREEKLLKR